MNPIIAAAAALTRQQVALLLNRQGYYKHKKKGTLVRPTLLPILSSTAAEEPASWGWLKEKGFATISRSGEPNAPWFFVTWTDLGRDVAEVLCLAEQLQPTILDVEPS